MCYGEYYKLEYYKIGVDSCGIADNRTNTGFNNLSLGEDIMIYPNPVMDLLIVDIPSMQLIDRYAVYDIYGKQLISLSERENRYVIDFTSFKCGIYYLKLSSLNASKIYRIIKM
jgi:hypothetical protein